MVYPQPGNFSVLCGCWQSNIEQLREKMQFSCFCFAR